MPTRLLSFLSEVERTLRKTASNAEGSAWESTRMVNYNTGLARLAFRGPRGAADTGSIFLQSFLLADGSLCLKISLGWDSATTSAQVAVYSQPNIDWQREAQQVAALWLAGPPAGAAHEASSEANLSPLAAVAS